MKLFLSMKKRVENYLNYRRHLGYELRIEGNQLLKFAEFADKKGHRGSITVDLAIEWASSSKKKSHIASARRLEIIRRFAKYCSVIAPETEIPPHSVFGAAYRRITPHIYSEQEIQHLLAATKKLRPQTGLRPLTFQCLFSLLVSTGLRISEAVRLTREDVDLVEGILKVRETKFHMSRYIPLHPTAIQALQEYGVLRDKREFFPKTSAFFLLDGGLPLTVDKAQYTFRKLRKKLGWSKPDNHRQLRIYDLRHTFVCRRLLTWYEEGKNIDQVISLLSTYLGHIRVTDTYWYITGIPELMAIAASRFEQFPKLFKGE